MSKKNSSVFICNSCSFQVSKWMGRCPECGEWNSFSEEAIHTPQRIVSNVRSGTEGPRRLQEIALDNVIRIRTDFEEFNRVLGGGLVRGSLVLIGGEPGIGKSTLLTKVMGGLAKNHHEQNVLYVSGEESPTQIGGRMRRLGIEADNLYIFHETNWQAILEQIKILKPNFLVLDSIQTTVSGELNSPPGTVSQIREVTYELMNHAKAQNITCFVIGHITKEGAIAGPKILEHMVDTVIYFEGDQFGHYRLLRGIKNRFGNANEVGIFEMTDKGLREVSNPSQYFLAEHRDESFGRSLTCLVEGSRTLFVEIQALVVENKYGTGRRTTQGIDPNRLAMLTAVVEKYLGIPLGFNDIYLNVVGGMKLDGRDSDLSVMASLLSSYKSRPLDSKTVFIGELGLSGEVRSAPQIEMRLKEISQLNYSRVVTSEKTAREYKNKFNIELIGLAQVSELARLV